MVQNGQSEFSGTLIEPQGVNAGAPIDAEHAGVPRKDPPDAKRPSPPTPQELSALLPDEMVGLPEQKPGYPGQQRSIETG
jgi:hypothetical protein